MNREARKQEKAERKRARKDAERAAEDVRMPNPPPEGGSPAAPPAD